MKRFHRDLLLLLCLSSRSPKDYDSLFFYMLHSVYFQTYRFSNLYICASPKHFFNLFLFGNIYLFNLILFYFLTLQYCIGFAIYQNESTTGIPVCPILNPPPTSPPIPSLWVVPVHQPQDSCILHRTWIGDSFHIWYYTCFNAILPIIPPSPSPTESSAFSCDCWSFVFFFGKKKNVFSSL